MTKIDEEKISEALAKRAVSECARCGAVSDFPFWDFIQTDEGWICGECEPQWEKDFLAKMELDTDNDKG